ncbi:DUF4139 domain-containing protein [Lutimonas halocynthiae]|uniref:DUF4139 domain-containing protein n=1 Tax=Lutimonas halocynthiae TaxID=1446477 RepID=UPI0025B32BBA|nr:DUF4139 domain-containing protein [Lutimonas halocynthiae]MDN3643277.1 DUF4139 domain-containing protein [Lutimonas halocynthiae]
MKKIAFIILCLSFSVSFSQKINEQAYETEISEVTVFIKGAQIVRKKAVVLNKGKTILKFTNLSPFINAKSVQVKANGNVTVLSVNHQQNFIDKLEKDKELEKLELEFKTIKKRIELEKTHLDILNEELSFLKENRSIGGKNQELSVSNLKEASSFYSSKLTELKLKEIDRNTTLYELREKEFDLQNQIKSMTSQRNYANGEVLVKIESEEQSKTDFEISYLVSNAGWLPSYDIRAKNINEPIELIYKANVKQDTKIDWKNVKLSLSSADPNLSGVAPSLKTYYLNYHTAPPKYKGEINQVEGIVSDAEGPLPGVVVLVKGTTIGTTTDFDGKYTLTMPETSSQLEFTFIGFKSKTINVNSSRHDVVLAYDEQTLDEVVVTSLGISRKKKSMGYATQKVNEDDYDNSIPLVQVENQTSINFEIDVPYSIMSDNKSYAVDMAKYKLAADYQYYSVPKIQKQAFLIASINNWEQYNLLEGEANIFFENTYVGKTLLDVRFTSDSLQISLGRDKNVIVDRKKISNYASKKFMGSKKEESRDWAISVKNNKSQSINMLVIDQIPVSTLDEIKVEVLELSKGKHNLSNGEVKWEFDLQPKENKDIDLKYIVKYPKNKSLVIE